MGDQAIPDHEPHHARYVDRLSVVRRSHPVSGRDLVPVGDGVDQFVVKILEHLEKAGQTRPVFRASGRRRAERTGVFVDEVGGDRRCDEIRIALVERSEVLTNDQGAWVHDATVL